MHDFLSTRITYVSLAVLAALAVMTARPSLSLADTYSVGGYFTVQAGGYNWTFNKSSDYVHIVQNPPSASTPVLTGGGAVWAGEFLDGEFMVRQSLGFEALVADRFSMTRFSFVNTFAYVPYRTEKLSFWFGPQLNLFYIWGRDTKKSLFMYTDYLFTNIPYYKKRTYRLLPIGTGLAMGLNYDVHENVLMSFEWGLHLSTSVYGQSREVGWGTASVTAYEGYVTISALYRFGEAFKPSEFDEQGGD